MNLAYRTHRRAGILSFIVVGVGLATIGAVGVLSFASPGTGASGSFRTGTGAAPAIRPAQPQEIGAVIILAGIDADALAASGLGGAGCDSVFDAGSTYCLQADRVTQFQLAHQAVNLAQARVMKPPVEGQGDLPTLSEAQGTLEDLRSTAFTFLTTGLDADKVAKLAKIHANKHWGLPAPYLVVDRADADWLALRGALAAQRFATRKGTDLADGPAAVIAAADADETVAQAKTDYASSLAAVKESWNAHSH